MATRGGWILAAAAIACAVPSLSAAVSPAGRWDATVVVKGVDIPFRFEIVGDGDDVRGSFFDGDTKITSRRGTFKDGVLTLGFDQYAATLEATLNDSGQLEGKYLRGSRPSYAFGASRFVELPRASGDVPSIAGIWTIPLDSEKGEQAWRFIVRQSGAGRASSPDRDTLGDV